LLLNIRYLKFEVKFLVSHNFPFAFSALTLLVVRQEGHPACKKLSGVCMCLTVSQGKVCTLSRWHEKLNHLLMAYLLTNNCTKNYWNHTVIVKDIVEGWVVCFFNTVYIACVLHSFVNYVFYQTHYINVIFCILLILVNFYVIITR